MMNLRKIKFQFHWRLRELSERLYLFFSEEMVLVYTMGKVGSSSIYYSLKKILKGKVIFTHRMNKESMDNYNAVFLKNNRKPHRTKIGELFLKKMQTKKVKIITLIREPISRNISDFFQDLPVYVDDFQPNKKYNMPYLLEQFNKNYLHTVSLHWFQNEFFATTNIDIFNTPFNTKKKYQFYKLKNIEVLLIRLDLEDAKKEVLIKEFLNLRNFKIERKNSASQKYYSKEYKTFISNCNFDTSYISKMYDSTFCTHFYSKTEIENFKIKFQ